MSVRAIALAALFVCVPLSLYAQSGRPVVAAEAIAGHAAFVDEAPIHHFVAGGALRYPLSARVGVGPEVVYMAGPGHDRDLFVTGNIWFDFLRPRAGEVRRVTPYFVAGAGLMRHTDRFSRDFTVHEWAATGGFGFRIALNDRWYVAPEARLGWEAHSRLTVSVGYRFGG